jgi:amphi-Trp domain-containing protein
MTDETTTTTQLDREEAADKLNLTASELRNGDTMEVPVGNKTITLDPPPAVSDCVDVVETRRRFRGSRETIRIELDWKPQ